MLQWFISFPEFAEFTEILCYLGKTQFGQTDWQCTTVQWSMTVNEHKTDSQKKFKILRIRLFIVTDVFFFDNFPYVNDQLL